MVAARLSALSVMMSGKLIAPKNAVVMTNVKLALGLVALIVTSVVVAAI